MVSLVICERNLKFSLNFPDEIKEHFIRFGPLTVDWPHKAQSKAYFPPKGTIDKFILLHDVD